MRAAAALVLSAAAVDCFAPTYLWAGGRSRASCIGAQSVSCIGAQSPRLVPPRHVQTAPKMESNSAVAADKPSDAWRDDILVLPTGFKIAVRIWGDETAAADRPQDRWIALHGWADNAATFDRLAPLMLRQGGTRRSSVKLCACVWRQVSFCEPIRMVYSYAWQSISCSVLSLSLLSD
jgi:hypothetical protein